MCPLESIRRVSSHPPKIMGDIHLDKYCESDSQKNVMLLDALRGKNPQLDQYDHG